MANRSIDAGWWLEASHSKRTLHRFLDVRTCVRTGSAAGQDDWMGECMRRERASLLQGVRARTSLYVASIPPASRLYISDDDEAGTMAKARGRFNYHALGYFRYCIKLPTTPAALQH